MKARFTILTLFIFCTLIGAGTVSAERDDDGKGSGEIAPHLAERIVARAPQGDLPAQLQTPDYTLVKTGSVTLGADEVAEYVVYARGKWDVDLWHTIQYLQTSVPTACVDFDYIHGTPGGYIGSGTTGEIEAIEASDSSLFEDQWAFAQINLDPTVAAGGSQTVIAILDAFQPNSGQLWTEEDVVHVTPTQLLGNQPDNAPNVELHGSMVTSLALAVAPNSKVMQVSVLNEWGVGHLFGVVEALDYVLTTFQSMPQNYLVVNMSFGSEAEDRCNIIESLLAAGEAQDNIVFVASSGNDSSTESTTQPLYPARSEHVVAVAASDRFYQQTSYSHDGDVMAPGGELIDEQGSPCAQTGHVVLGYAPISAEDTPSTSGHYSLLCSVGTSFAAPLVAGHAASLLGDSTYNGKSTVQLIEEGATQNQGVIDVTYTTVAVTQ